MTGNFGSRRQRIARPDIGRESRRVNRRKERDWEGVPKAALLELRRPNLSASGEIGGFGDFLTPHLARSKHLAESERGASEFVQARPVIQRKVGAGRS